MYDVARDFRWAERARWRVAMPAAPSNHIRLSGGLGFPPTFPNIVQAAVEAAENRAEALQYGPLFGLNDLRDAVVGYLAEDGVTSARDNILIVNGAKQGLDLACRVFMEKGDTIIVSSPTYMTAVAILKSHEVSFLEIPHDADGMIPDELEARLHTRRRRGETLPKLLFEVPDFHNPTGVTLSARRRERLVELAAEYDFRIIEDDPYRRVRFEGEPIPPIKSFDTGGFVIGLGTVSKILAPGLRIGWVNADAEIVQRMAAQKSDHGTNPFVQRIAAKLYASGEVARHIELLKTTLRRHRDVMVEEVERRLPGAKVRAPQGGYFLWVELPKEMDGDDLVRAGLRHGVEILSGRPSFAEAARPNFIRLAYSYSGPSEIVEGIARLGDAYAELMSLNWDAAAPSENN